MRRRNRRDRTAMTSRSHDPMFCRPTLASLGKRSLLGSAESARRAVRGHTRIVRSSVVVTLASRPVWSGYGGSRKHQSSRAPIAVRTLRDLQSAVDDGCLYHHRLRCHPRGYLGVLDPCMEASDPPANSATNLLIVAHRWWWEVHHPNIGIVIANEIHVHVNQPEYTGFRSADVIHDFWVPELGRKIDIIPREENLAGSPWMRRASTSVDARNSAGENMLGCASG